MQRIKLPEIQGYYLTLSLKDTILTFEVEEESSGKISCLNLNEHSVSEATNGFFKTPQDLFQGLKSAAKGTDPKITLILSKEKLTYIGPYSTGASQVQHSFILKLTEKRVEPVETVEKMTLRLKELEKLNEDVKSAIIFKCNIYFEDHSASDFQFQITDKNKTAVSSGSHSPLKIAPQISSSGEHCYTLRIKKIKRNIFFGIEPSISWIARTLSSFAPCCLQSERVYEYCTLDGMIEGTVSKKAIENGPYGSQDSMLKMVVDMDNGALAFYVDNRLVNSCKISKFDKYTAYVRFGDAGDSVTLL